MEIYSDDSLNAAGVQQVSNQPGAKRLAAMRPAVLTSIAEVGDYGCSVHCSCAAASIGYEQEFEQMLVHRRASGLNQINIVTADAFLQFNMQFAIGKSL
jgi:hypothetical protein